MVADSCEADNDSLGSKKTREFLDLLNVLLAYLEGLCSMELVYMKPKQLLSGTRSLLKSTDYLGMQCQYAGQFKKEGNTFICL
jgi:hypothetical protein